MWHGLIRLQPESLTLSGLPIYVARIPAAPFPRDPFSFSLYRNLENNVSLCLDLSLFFER
jgi:hypothetical protein